ITEWKKAYIDYRGLKKRIKAIRKSHDSPNTPIHALRTFTRGFSIGQPSPGASSPTRGAYQALSSPPPNGLERDSSSGLDRTPEHVEHAPSEAARSSAVVVHESTPWPRLRTSSSEVGPNSQHTPATESAEYSDDDTSSHDRVSGGPFDETLSTIHSRTDSTRLIEEPDHVGIMMSPVHGSPVSARSSGISQRLRALSNATRRMTAGSRAAETTNTWAPASVEDLLAGIGPNEIAFFTAVDQELDKVDAFYSERERDAKLKVATLIEQFDELRGHEQLESQKGLWPGFFNFINSINPVSSSRPQSRGRLGAHPSTQSLARPGSSLAQDPETYKNARKKLKRAVLEFYRGLELLQNYRILNWTGFRKALKKFEKVTKIPSQSLYMRERVETRSFASGESCDQLLKEIERIYASRF
ncbi:hypothetical protein FRC12_021664, partial [Ceratobasidium sp. 428]